MASVSIVEPNLVQLGQGVYALLAPDPRFGYSNVGVVIDHDGLTVIDTTATPIQAAVTAARIGELTSQLGLPVKRVVLTSSRVAYCGGGEQFWSAAFYGSEQTSVQLDAPANPAAWRALLPDFASVYTDEFTTRAVTHTVTEKAELTPAIVVEPVIAESAGNLVVTVESANVVFAGAVASFGVTPLGYDGYFDQWVATLDNLIKDGITVVPGHGPTGGSADVADLSDYLIACMEADGATALPEGPWRRWVDRRFDRINVERAALLATGRDEPPPAMFELLGL